MMLYKLALSNLKKSFKDYAIYFCTLILGVAIFYVFNAIESQTVLMNLTSSTRDIVTLLIEMLSGLSIFVSIVLGFLIIYASQFLIKRRNKEFGIYMILGMSKSKISRILFYETFFIGLISLLVGLGLGFLLSQAMSVFVINLFEADMTQFKFIFSIKACIKTCLYFGLMYLFVMIFNTWSINKCKLIELLNAKRKNEDVKMKNPIICVIVFILAAIALGYAYYCVTSGFTSIGESLGKLFKPILIGIITTLLLFWSVSGLLLKLFTSLKRIYYKNLNSFTLRQFASKINTTVLSTSVICIMLFVTLCLLSSAISIKKSLSEEIGYATKADLTMEYNVSKVDTDLFDTFTNAGYDFKSDLSDYVLFDVYTQKDGTLTWTNTLGDTFDYIQSQYPFLQYDSYEEFMPISQYNTLARLYGLEEYTLKNDEYIIICDYPQMAQVRNIPLQNRQVITVLNTELKPKYDHCVEGFYEINAGKYNSGFIVDPDTLVINEEDVYDRTFISANYIGNTKEEKVKVEERLIKGLSQLSDYMIDTGKETYYKYNTKIEIIDNSVGLSALATFIALYLGIIFLICSTAILALQELSESADNIERYEMLRRLGADEKMINKALFNQIGIYFLFPLLLALIHSYFGMKFASIILQVLGTPARLSSSFYAFIFLLVIYGGYFLLTYITSRNMIKERI